MTPKELSEKIIAGILRSPGVTYTRLEKHAKTLNIPAGIFENAMQLVHQSKKVQSKILKGVMVYVIKETPKTPVDLLAEWKKNNNYPYPLKCKHCVGKLCALCFPFYNPEQDTPDKIRERLMMTRDEYKAKSEGKTFIPKKKRYEYAGR